MDNLDALIEKQKARFMWLHEMFSTKQSRILFVTTVFVAFLLGVFLS